MYRLVLSTSGHDLVHLANLSIAMPAAVRAARTARARSTAPGVSPWTHNDRADTATGPPSTSVTTPSSAIRTLRATTASASVSTAPASDRRTSRPSRGVGAIGECFCHEGHGSVLGGLLERRADQPEQRLPRRVPGDCIGDCLGHVNVARRRVVQRPVRLHVADAITSRPREGVEARRSGIRCRLAAHRRPSRSVAARIRPDLDSRPGAPIATPRATARSHTWRMVRASPAWKPQATLALLITLEQGGIITEPPHAETLTQVGVQVDHHAVGH